MPGSLHTWYSLYDLGVLGDREARLTGEIELAQLTRLRELLHADRGSVRASLLFGQRGSDCVTVELDYEVVLELECQRCLEPLVQEMSEHVSIALLGTDTPESCAPEGYEPVVVSGDRLQPATLIEDELIISLPLVPKHARKDECGNLARSLESSAPEMSSVSELRPPQRSH